MGKSRMLKTRFWTDGFIITLDPVEKLLFLYLLTNQYTSICGIYECPLKVMAFETGIDRDAFERVIERFKGRIHYKNNWVYIRNFIKHQSSSPTIQIAIKNELSELPVSVKTWMVEIDEEYGHIQEVAGFSHEDIEKELQKGKDDVEKMKKDTDTVVQSYIEKINSRSRITEGAIDKVRVRLNQYTVDELLDAIDRFSRSGWWMRNNSRRGLAWFFRSEDQIARFLELEPDIESANSEVVRIRK